jgi:hypothetical protein
MSLIDPFGPPWNPFTIASHETEDPDEALLSQTLPSLRLFSLNCYLIPRWFSSKCQDQDIRAELIGSYAAAYADLVCFQEMWGSHLYLINSKLEPTHEILSHNKSRFFIQSLLFMFNFFNKKHSFHYYYCFILMVIYLYLSCLFHWLLTQ